MLILTKTSRFLLGTLVCLTAFAKAAEPSEPVGLKVKLSLADYLRMVVQQNETIQAQLLATEAGRQRALAERGAFEPEFVASAQHVRNRRPNTVEQQRNLSGVPVLDERNNLFDTGIEALTNTGAKVRLGYTLNNFNNNLRPLTSTTVDPDPNGRTDEWQSFAGLTITQPLLKNGGKAVALSNLRIAAINSDAAFQEYRRQLMVTLSQAESAYWGVYFAQEQLRFLDESVAVAESLLSDSREKVKAGRGTDLDVLEAEAGLALRRTKRNEALQRFTEAAGQLLVFAGRSPRDTGVIYVAADDPEFNVPKPSYGESWSTAAALNPDYLIQKKKYDEAIIRLNLARNQRLPELNLKGSVGLNGLGDSPGESFDEVSNGGFPSWSVGLEMRIPLGGGIRGDHEYAAMLATVKQVRMQTQGMETQLANALNTSIRKLKNNRASANDYRTMIRFNEDLLKTERDRVAAGKVEGRRVLEVEAGLYEVKQGLADAQVQTRRAALELYLAEGSVLKRRGMEFTPADLRDQTAALLNWDKKPKKGKGTAKPIAKPKVRFAPTHLDLREETAVPAGE
jgi:outer membrane protein TolC